MKAICINKSTQHTEQNFNLKQNTTVSFQHEMNFNFQIPNQNMKTKHRKVFLITNNSKMKNFSKGLNLVENSSLKNFQILTSLRILLKEKKRKLDSKNPIIEEEEDDDDKFAHPSK